MSWAKFARRSKKLNAKLPEEIEKKLKQQTKNEEIITAANSLEQAWEALSLYISSPTASNLNNAQTNATAARTQANNWLPETWEIYFSATVVWLYVQWVNKVTDQFNKERVKVADSLLKSTIPYLEEDVLYYKLRKYCKGLHDEADSRGWVYVGVQWEGRGHVIFDWTNKDNGIEFQPRDGQHNDMVKRAQEAVVPAYRKEAESRLPRALQRLEECRTAIKWLYLLG